MNTDPEDLQEQLLMAQAALDLLGLALAEHGHQWTPEERRAYECAMQGAE